MEGRATPTIETSSPSRKRTPHSTTRAPHRRASHLVAAGSAPWGGSVGGGSTRRSQHDKAGWYGTLGEETIPVRPGPIRLHGPVIGGAYHHGAGIERSPKGAQGWPSTHVVRRDSSRLTAGSSM